MATRMEAYDHWEAVTKTTGIFGLFSDGDISKEVELIDGGSDDKTTALVVREVDFYPQDNASDHQTDDYDLVTEHNVPVLRRSQVFSLAIKFDQEFNPKTQQCHISLEFGPYPSKLENTIIELEVSNSQMNNNIVDPESWNAFLISNNDKTAIVQIQIGSKACVGLWRCKIKTGVEDSDQSFIYKCKVPLYILFNPFDQDDSVFMPNQRQRIETVASDSGMVFVGALKHRGTLGSLMKVSCQLAAFSWTTAI